MNLIAFYLHYIAYVPELGKLLEVLFAKPIKFIVLVIFDSFNIYHFSQKSPK